RWTLRDAERHRPDRLEKLVVGDAAVHQTPGLRLGAREESAGVDQFERAMTAQSFDEQRVAARVEHGADPREGRTKAGLLGDRDHVARQRQAQADAETGALHGGKGRRRELAHAPNEWIEHLGKYALGIVSGRVDAGQVSAGAEAAAFGAGPTRGRRRS